MLKLLVYNWHSECLIMNVHNFIELGELCPTYPESCERKPIYPRNQPGELCVTYPESVRWTLSYPELCLPESGERKPTYPESVTWTLSYIPRIRWTLAYIPRICLLPQCSSKGHITTTTGTCCCGNLWCLVTIVTFGRWNFSTFHSINVQLYQFLQDKEYERDKTLSNIEQF